MGKWIDNVAILKFKHKITNVDIAKHLQSTTSNAKQVTPEYVSMVLHSHKTMPNAEQRIMTAINEIIAERT